MKIPSERKKLYLFDAISLVSRIIYPYYRFKYRASKLTGKCLVNVGSGNTYIDGMINIDIIPPWIMKTDVWMDLRGRLPFPDQSIDVIYCSHVIEHIYIEDLPSLLKEFMRVLKPGGSLRVALPDLDKAIEAYSKGDKDFFYYNPDYLNPFNDDSIAARFSRQLLINSAHKMAYNLESMSKVLTSAGFVNIKECQPGKSDVLDDELLGKQENTTHARESFYLECSV